jgi:hypothetical protein
MTASITNATTKAVANDLSVAELLASYIIEAAYSAVGARATVRNESLMGRETDTMKFPAWPALSAAAVAETADLTNTAINPTNVTITVGEVGLMATVTDAQQEDDILAGLDGYARQLGRALADKMDADVTSLYSGFSTAVGDITNGLSQEDFLNAIRELDSNDAPGGRVAVLHPVQWSQLGKDIVVNGGSVWGADSPQDSRFGQQGPNAGVIFNVPVWQTTNVPTNTRTNPFYDGALYSSEALGFVSKREGRVEFDRDASFRLTEIVTTSRYGVGELVDDYGVALYSNQTAA